DFFEIALELLNRKLAARIWPVVAKPAPMDRRGLQPEQLRQRDRRCLFGLDEIAARLRVLAVLETGAPGPDAPADAIARLDDSDVGAAGLESVRGREPGK